MGRPCRPVPAALLNTLLREEGGVCPPRVDGDLSGSGGGAGHHEGPRHGSETTLPKYEICVPPPAYLPA